MKTHYKFSGSTNLPHILLIMVLALSEACSVLYAQIPFIKAVILVDNNSANLSYRGSYQYSIKGDYQGDRWQTHTNYPYFAFSELLTSEAQKTIPKAFKEKIVKTTYGAECFSLILDWETTNNAISHEVEAVGSDGTSPRNCYTVNITGELRYSFRDPNHQEILSGLIIGQGTGFRKDGVIRGTFLGKESNSEGTFKGAYKTALEVALRYSLGELVNILKNSPEVAEASRNIQQRKSLPSDLIADVKFSDENAIIPNNMIDGGEQAIIHLAVENKGQGIAFDVEINIENQNEYINLPVLTVVGEIQPGKSHTLNIPLSTSLDLKDGVAPVTIQIKEKRGYDAQPIQLQIPLRHLDKPKFEITNLEINDAKIGLADGNGNGIPENGETIELIAYVKNTGVGKAYESVYTLADVPAQIEVIQQSENLGTILPGDSKKGKVVLKIPQTYTTQTIPNKISIRDALGADVLEKSQTLSMGVNLPVLAYQLNKSDAFHNGQEAKIQLIAENAGKLPAGNVEVQVTSNDPVTLSNNILKIPSLAPGSKAAPLTVNISIPRTYTKNTLNLNIGISQSNFSGLNETETLPIELWKPELQISGRLVDGNQNQQIEQGEKIDIIVTVTNNGQLAAEGAILRFQTPDPRFNSERALGTIPPRTSQDATFTLTIPGGTQTGSFPVDLTVTHRDFESATSKLPYEITPRGAAIVTIQGEQPPAAVAPSLALGASRNLPPTVFSANLREGDVLAESPFPLKVSFSDDQQLSKAQMRLNGTTIYNSQTDPSSQEQFRRSGGKSLIIEKELSGLQAGENVLEITASDNADEVTPLAIRFQYTPGKQSAGGIVLNPSIDIENVPHSNMKNPEAVAVILGVEQYKDIPKVTYARRDAALFREYAIHVLGVPDDASHIYYKTDADVTGGEFRKLFGRGNWLEKHISPASDVYIYYAGHGAPDIDSKTPYLIPYEGDANYVVSTGFGLDEIYEKLGQLNARSITVFLDACFSGLTRDNEMLLADARPVGISLESPVLRSQKMVTFSAASGSQISNGYPGMQHGLFTYFLLKGLKGEADQNGNKEITVSELEAYLVANVQRVSGSFGSNREQRPQVMGMDIGRALVRF